jgi:hypothetical protein
MKFFLLLFSSALFASVNEPLRGELFSGYRSDRLHWHLVQPAGGALTYTELYRDVQYWENGLTFKVVHRDVTFFLRGAYGVFGAGNLNQKYSNLSFTSDQPHFIFDTDGWTADGSGYFGYAVNLTADRTYKVILTPLLGYSAHFEHISRKGGEPNPLQTEDYSMFSSLPSQLHLSWYGFLMGGSFTIEPGNQLVLNVGYSYHFIGLRLKSAFQNQVILPASDTTSSYTFTAKESGNMGQSGWAQLDFLLPHFWRAGVGALIHYFSSQIVDTTLKQQNAPNLDQKLKVRWTAVSGWVQVSREF